MTIKQRGKFVRQPGQSRWWLTCCMGLATGFWGGCAPDVQYGSASRSELSEADGAVASDSADWASDTGDSDDATANGASGGSSASSSGRGSTSSSGAAGGTGGGSVPAACEMIEEEATTVLSTHCASCHGPGTNVVFDTILQADALEASGKIVPGDADGSAIFQRISSGNMPPASVATRPSQEEIDVLGEWIDTCLVAPSASAQDNGCGLPQIDGEEQVAAMVSDILRTDQEDREFIRYFTLHHVVNAGGCEEELDLQRYALAKAVNAVSLGTRIVVPQPVDDLETVLRIDLRDYEWDETANREDKWELLVDANPYAFEIDSDDADLLQDITGTRIPFQTGDWFVNAGMQPPLYHELLEIPETVPELEQQLALDIQENIDNRDVVRAGFLDSGVSSNNRVIERHELAVSGARTLWVSYDFANSAGQTNVFAEPIDFEPAGSEIIFTLPNGLHGYMVAEATGDRLDEAPTNIVVDDMQDDRNVRNGISCISCHEAGMKLKQDEVRAYVLNSSDFNGDERDEVLQLYPERDEFDELIARDMDLFMAALSQLPQEGIKAEPVIAVFDEFEENVDLTRAAAELGVSETVLLRELGGLSPELAPLATSSIKRETFQENFAETVCRLNLGLADDAACFRNDDDDDDQDVDDQDVEDQDVDDDDQDADANDDGNDNRGR